MASYMCSLGGYPLGARDDPRAPYNEKPEERVNIEVTISVTYSKTLKVLINKDHTNSDLKDAIVELGILPKQVLEEKAEALQEDIDSGGWDFTGYQLDAIKKAISNLYGWHEDEFEVIES